MTILAWLATIATGSFLAAQMTQGVAVLNYENYTKPQYQGTLMIWGILLVCAFFNTVIANQLPGVEATFLVLHVVGFFAILIPLVHFSPHAKASDVFATYLNEGGWPTKGVTFMVGMTGAAFPFAGADAAVHVSRSQLYSVLCFCCILLLVDY